MFNETLCGGDLIREVSTETTSDTSSGLSSGFAIPDWKGALNRISILFEFFNLLHCKFRLTYEYHPSMIPLWY